jgi:hypothetical protein
MFLDRFFVYALSCPFRLPGDIRLLFKGGSESGFSTVRNEQEIKLKATVTIASPKAMPAYSE